MVSKRGTWSCYVQYSRLLVPYTNRRPLSDRIERHNTSKKKKVREVNERRKKSDELTEKKER